MKFVNDKITDKLPINVMYAKNQEGYLTLPAHKRKTGQVIVALELTDEQKKDIAENGKVYLSMLTFNKPLQPIYLCTNEKEIEEHVEYTDEQLLETTKER